VQRLSLVLIRAALAALVAVSIGCGGDDDDGGSTADSGPTADSAPPDSSTPDAQVCALTMCGDECVDTETDSAHCGGCDMACASPGQICSGALPCTCPPAFIPAELNPPALDEVNSRLFPGLLVGVGPIIEGSLISAMLIAFVEATPIDTDIDLAETTAPTPPFIAAAYDVDINTMDVHSPFLATSGIVNFTEVCAEGLRGTLTDALFVEVAGVTDPTPIEGGCEIPVKSVTFDIGQPCGGAPDAAP
jgi:hypothetical protein